jgi:hypothetical protein
MRTEELIRSLAGDLRPIRRLPRVERRTVSWAVFALACASLVTIALGARPDLAAKIRDPAFLAAGVLLLAIFILAARAAFVLSVPGGGARWATLASCGLLFWGALVAGAASSETQWLSGARCLGRLACVAVVPAIAMVLMLREAAPLHPRWTGAFAMLSAASLAAVATQVICPKDGALHVALWHLAPILLAAVAGTRLGAVVVSSPHARLE